MKTRYDRGVLSDAEIERLRQSGLRLDRQGQFWHEGEPVKHEGLHRAFHRWIDRLDDGRFILRLDERRFCYIDVEDAPFIARSLRWEGEQAIACLDNEREEALDAGHIRLDEYGVRASVGGGRFPVRLSTRAWQALTARAEERDGKLCLVMGGVEVPIE